MMTIPFGHSPPTHSEPLPWALSQPASWSRQGSVRGTVWPIVTGQRRASAIVTGRAGCLAGASLGGVPADRAMAAEPVTVLAGPPPQPRRTTLIAAARAVPATSLRGMGRLLPLGLTVGTPVSAGRFRWPRCQCAELAMARAAVLLRLPSRRSAT